MQASSGRFSDLAKAKAAQVAIPKEDEVLFKSHHEQVLLNQRADRMQIIFDDIPPRELLQKMKSFGWNWQKPWKSGKAGTMPYNPTTCKPYRGGNVLALSIAAMRKRYDDPRWCTYKQAAEKGWQVKKCGREKATAIEFWEVGRGKKDQGEWMRTSRQN